MTLIRNILGGPWGWVTSHARLMIDYALIAAFVATLGLYYTLKLHSAHQDVTLAKQAEQVTGLQGDVATSQSNEAQLAAANQVQDQALAQLQALRDKDARAFNGLRKDFAQGKVATTAVKAKLSELEKNNAQAKQLFDNAVPSAVGCVLDDTPCPAAASSAHSNQGGGSTAK